MQELVRREARPHPVQRLGHLGRPGAAAAPGRPAPPGSASSSAAIPRRGPAGPGSPRPAPAAPAPRRSGGVRCGCRAGAGPWRRCPRSHWARRRSTPAPNGISASRRSGRCAGAHGPRQHLDHPHVALELGGGGVVDAAHPHLGHEPRHRRQADARLPQGGEHLLDVAQEERVGADHEHALALEREAVRVEQVGGAVQRDGRLARARAALDDEDARPAASG